MRHNGSSRSTLIGATKNEAGGTRVQRLVRRLTRSDATAMTLPLTLALMGVSSAREREEQGGHAHEAGKGAAPANAQAVAGDKLVVYWGNEAIVQHLLTEAEIASQRVRVALAMSRDEAGSADLRGATPEEIAAALAGAKAKGSKDASGESAVTFPAEDAGAAGDVDAAPQGEDKGEGQSEGKGAAVLAATAGDGTDANASASATPATEEDDDDHRGLIWLLIGGGVGGIALAAGGGGGSDDKPPVSVDPPPPPPPPPSGISGEVVKGYVQGAAVYLDIDHDGQPDGEPVYTDAQGRFSFTTTELGASLIAFGGVDTLTNAPLTGLIFRAPPGSTVVTPLTTLLDEIMKSDTSLTAAQAQERLASALGITLPSGVDLRTYDSVEKIADGGASIEDASEAVLNTILSIQSLLVSSGAATAIDGAQAAIGALAQVLMDQDSPLDLSSAADVRSVLVTAFASVSVGASNDADLDVVAGAIAAVNGTLVEASGLGEEALQATRYALSGFQDVMANVGANAHETLAWTHDISFGSNSKLASEVGDIAAGGVADLVAEHARASIRYDERLEGGRFVFALNPELKLYQGAPDKIDTVTVKFEVDGVVVQRETRGSSGEIQTETLTPAEDGTYTLAYGELDKIFITPPAEFYGQLGADVTVHYVGLNVTDTPDTLGIEITAVNDAPTGSDSSATLLEDEPHVFTLADFPVADPTDAIYGSANGLGAVIVRSLPTNGTLYLGEHALTSDDVANGYSISADAIYDGEFRFVPAEDANGESYATFDFQVRDNGGTANGGVDLDSTIHQFRFDVTAVSDAPVPAENGATIIEREVRTLTDADFGFTDPEGNSLAAVIITSLPERGTLYYGESPLTDQDVADGFVVTVEALADGLLRFDAGDNNEGDTSFQYRLKDNGGAEGEGKDTSDSVAFTVTFDNANDAPVAHDATAILDEDSVRTLYAADFSFTDAEDNDLLTLIITTLPESGTLYFADHALTPDDLEEGGYHVSATDLADGKLTYIPVENDTTSTTFTYRIQDDGGTVSGGVDTSEPATLTLDLKPVDDAPVASDNGGTVNEGDEYVFGLESFQFSDVEDQTLAAVIITSIPESGSLYYGDLLLTPEDVAAGLEISALDIAEGALRFIADDDTNGDVTFGYKLRDSGSEDNGGVTVSDAATFTLNIEGVNDAPTAEDNEVSVEEDQSYTFSASDFPFTDVEANALAAVIIRTLPENGYLYLGEHQITLDDIGDTGYVVTAGQLDENQLTFAPAADFNGTVSFDYSVQDDGGTENGGNDTSESATLTLDLDAVNDDPDLSLPYYSQDHTLQLDGEPLQVNTFTNGNQENPSIAALPNGGLVITWISNGQDGSGSGVYLQFFDRKGEKQGEEIRVNSATVGDQFDPIVGVLPGTNNAVVFWAGPRNDNGTDIFGAVVTPEGVVSESEEALVTAEGDQFEPALSISPYGAVLTWTSDGQDGSGYGIYAGTFEQGTDFSMRVNTTTAFDQFEPDVAMLENGSIAFVWTGNDGVNSRGIYLRLMGPGDVDSGEIRVNVETEGNQQEPSVAALAGGGFVVTYTSPDESGKGVYAQVFDSEGEPRGEPIRVHENTLNDQSESSVVGLPTGGFVVTWTSWGSIDSTLDVYAQRFGVDGLPIGDPVVINTHTTYEQTSPDISVMADGGLVVTWQSNNQDGSGYGIYAQRIEPVAANFIEDGDYVLVAPTATVGDVELGALNESDGDWRGARIVVARNGEEPDTDDDFGFMDGHGYTLVDGYITRDGDTIARFRVDDGELKVTFGDYEATPTTEDVNYILQHITYGNLSDDFGSGSIRLRYTVYDGNGEDEGAQGWGGEGISSGTVRVQLTPVNDAPEPDSNSLTVDEDGEHTFSSSDFSFTDEEGDDLSSVYVSSLPSHGTLYLGQQALEAGTRIYAEELASLRYVPGENFNGSDSFEYSVTDDGDDGYRDHDTSASATFNITVNAVNDAPDLALETGSGTEWVVNTTLDLTDQDDQTLSLREALALAQDGDRITFAHDLYADGAAVLYLSSTLSVTKQVYINGLDGDDAISFVKLMPAGDGDFPIMHVTSDVGGDKGGAVLQAFRFQGQDQDYSASPVGLLNSGTLTLSNVDFSYLSTDRSDSISATDAVAALLNAEGATLYASQVTFQHNSAYGYNGYVAGDAYIMANHGLFHAVDVSFNSNTVNGGNGALIEGMGGDGYIFFNDGTLYGQPSVDEQTNAYYGGMGDAAGQGGTFAGDESLGSTEWEYVVPGGGTPTFVEDGEVILIAKATVADIELDALNSGDGDWAGASLTVKRQEISNSADSFGFKDTETYTLSEGQIWKGQVAIANFSVTEGVLTISFLDPQGEQNILTNADVKAVIGRITYSNSSDDPPSSITLEYTLKDGNVDAQGSGGELEDTAIVEVNITPVNDAPSASGTTVTLNEDATHTFSSSDFPFTDAESDSLAAVKITSLPSHGTLTLNGEPVTLNQLVTANDIGTLVYTPSENYHGSDSFGYSVRDDGGTANGGSDTGSGGTVSITVNSQNDDPNLGFSDGVGLLTQEDVINLSNDDISGLQSLRAVGISPDGANVYAVSYTQNILTIFDRDPQTGALSFDGSIDLADMGGDAVSGGYSVTVSPDGKSVYVAAMGSSTLSVFTRDEQSGELSFVETLKDGTGEGPQSISGACWVTVSPDSHFVYVVSILDHSVSVFERNEQDGTLTNVDVVIDGESGVENMDSPSLGTISPDGKFMYVTGFSSNSVVVFQRDADSGALTYITSYTDEDFDTFGAPVGVAVSPDGENLYVVGSQSQALTVFSRDSATGLLTYQQALHQGVEAEGMQIPLQVIVSPDGKSVYVTSREGDGIVEFARDTETGTLTFQAVIADGDNDGAVTGLDGVFPIVISADGKSVYAGSIYGNSLTHFSRASGDAPEYIENGTSVHLTPFAAVSDAELDALRNGDGDWSGASVTVSRAASANSEDDFGFSEIQGYTFGEGTISKVVGQSSYVIGTFSEVSGTFTISFSTQDVQDAAVPTKADVQAILRAVTYSNTSDDPPESVTLSYKLSDGNTSSQGEGGEGTDYNYVTVHITPVNDAPTAQDKIVTIDEDASYTLKQSDFGFSDTEGDDLDAVIITSLPEHGKLYLGDEEITSDDILDGGYVVEAGEISEHLLRFVPNEDYYGSTSFGFKVRDDGGTDHEGENTSSSYTLTFDMRSVNDAPELDLPANGYTFVVDTLEDVEDENDGVLSLREALAVAQDGDSIGFDPDLLTNGPAVIELSETLTISKQVYIDGTTTEGMPMVGLVSATGFTTLVVTEEVGSDRGGAVLHGLGIMGGGDSVVLSDLPAGGVVNHGALTLANVLIGSHHAMGLLESSAASALFNGPDATLNMDSVLIQNNVALGGDSGAVAIAGAAYTVWNQGTMHVVNVLLQVNSNTGGAGTNEAQVSVDGGDAYTFFNSGTLYGMVDFGSEDLGNTNLPGAPWGEADEGYVGEGGGNEPAGPTDFEFVPPELQIGDGARAEYAADGEPVWLSPEANLADVELDALNTGAGNWSGATIRVQREESANSDDVFGFSDPIHNFMPSELVWQQNGTITKNDQVIGTYTNSAGTLLIHFTGFGNAIPTTHDVNTLLRQITYSNSSKDPEGEIVIEYRVADGNASFHGTQGSGGEGVTFGTVTVDITPIDLGTPVITLNAEDDTNAVDGITSNGQPNFTVALSENVYEGVKVNIYVQGQSEPVATHTVTESEATNHAVVLTLPSFLYDGTYKLHAVLEGSEGNSESSASAPYIAVIDSEAPDTVTLDLSETHTLRADDAANMAISGTAEAGAVVKVTLSAGEASTEYSTTADADGRFHVVVDATEFEAATVNVSAVAMDRAGNTTEVADTSTLTITPVDQSNAAIELAGTGSEEWLNPTVGPAVMFTTGPGGNTDHFIGAAGLNTVRINGSMENYYVTLATADQRSTQQSLLTGHSITLQENEPLIHVSQWREGTGDVWLQADRIVFNDGVLRVTSDGLVAEGSEGVTVSGQDGDDYIIGGVHADTLLGGKGDDYISGGAGDDTLVSQSGIDTLVGGEGNDKLVVFGDAQGSGPNSAATLFGGTGEDVFVVAPQAGFSRNVSIGDFVIGEDKLDLSGLQISDGQSGYREITANDLDLASLSAQLHEDGSAEISLSQFVTADGHESVQGTLTLTLAAGETSLSESDFILSGVQGTLQDDDLLNLSRLTPPP